MTLFRAEKTISECKPKVLVSRGMYVEVLGVDGGTFVLMNLHTKKIFTLAKSEFEEKFKRLD